MRSSKPCRSSQTCASSRKDVLEPASLDAFDNDYDYVFHLAAIIGVSNVLKRPYAVLGDNVTMLLSLLSFAKRQTKLKRFVFASTSEVYAGLLENFTLPIPTPESVALGLPDLRHPRTSYMLSKIYGEALCHQSGLPFTLVRPHNFYGPRMGLSHVVPELPEARLRREGRRFAGSVLGRPPPHVLLHRRRRRDAGARRDLREMSERDAEPRHGSARGDDRRARGEGRADRRPQARAGAEAGHVRLARAPLPGHEKTAALTGYRSQVSLEDGIRRTFDWYRTNVFDGNATSAI